MSIQQYWWLMSTINGRVTLFGPALLVQIKAVHSVRTSKCNSSQWSLWPTAIDKRSNQSGNWHSFRKVLFGLKEEEKWALHQSIDCTIWMQISGDISISVNQLPGRCLHTDCSLWASNTYVMSGERGKPEKGTTVQTVHFDLLSLMGELIFRS